MLINVTAPIQQNTPRRTVRQRVGLATEPSIATAPSQQADRYSQRRDDDSQWSIFA